MQILLFIIGLILFISLVIVHEWGHYWVAKRNGVKALEFGIGIPPRAWSKKLKSGVLFSLNWLPLGGFVRLKGENDEDARPHSFGAASLGAKSKIMLAGIGANLIVGLLMLTVLALIGMPKLIDKTYGAPQDQFTVASDTKIVERDLLVGEIQDGSPAQKAGLSGHDLILSIASGSDKRDASSAQTLHDATQAFAGKTVTIVYKHNGAVLSKSVTLRTAEEVQPTLKTDNPKGYLGIAPLELQIRRSTWSAPIVALGMTKQLTVLTMQGLGHAFAGLGSLLAGFISGNHEARQNGQAQASSQVGGPVAIGAAIWGYSSLGITFVLTIIAIISLLLAIFNILPIPALDGGRLFMLLFSRGLLHRPLNKQVEERVVATSMVLLLVLFVLITVVDVRRFL
ncbi:MAG TPA: M50 family metallopeptidase [Candidatus Saccharimonadales bacterium]|nr:M50 family metallopeptidase [Candidatus Saccharimonadales bacterium]